MQLRAIFSVKRPPTDFELVKAIYDRHRGDFESGGPRIKQKLGVLIPIDIPAIADSLGVSADTVFGRLYHHLDPKYAPEPAPGGSRKVLFTPVAGDDSDCVNFPMLEAVHAGLWQERRRDLLAVAAAVSAFGISIASLIVAILALSS
jgi:hypothetical protein